MSGSSDSFSEPDRMRRAGSDSPDWPLHPASTESASATVTTHLQQLAFIDASPCGISVVAPLNRTVVETADLFRSRMHGCKLNACSRARHLHDRRGWIAAAVGGDANLPLAHLRGNRDQPEERPVAT